MRCRARVYISYLLNGGGRFVRNLSNLFSETEVTVVTQWDKKIRVGQMSQWDTCPVGQLSSGTTVLVGQMSQWDKCPVGQMSGGQMSSGTVVQWDECPVGQLSVGQLSNHRNLHCI